MNFNPWRQKESICLKRATEKVTFEKHLARGYMPNSAWMNIFTPSGNLITIFMNDYRMGWDFTLNYRVSKETGTGCRCNIDPIPFEREITDDLILAQEREGLCFARKLGAELYKGKEDIKRNCSAWKENEKMEFLKKFANSWHGVQFQSSSGLTEEFKKFSSDFKAALKKDLDQYDIELVNFSRGHFYCSAFVRREDGEMFYICLWDVRMKDIESPQLYRTAKDEKDYTGGTNQYAQIWEIPEKIVAGK